MSGDRDASFSRRPEVNPRRLGLDQSGALADVSTLDLKAALIFATAVSVWTVYKEAYLDRARFSWTTKRDGRTLVAKGGGVS